jgi:hypothetical protein
VQPASERARADGRVLEFNPAAETAFGCRRAALRCRPDRETKRFLISLQNHPAMS